MTTGAGGRRVADRARDRHALRAAGRAQRPFLRRALPRRRPHRTVHTRHEQGCAYMALGAALATGKPQAYAVVPGPGLLNTGAALLTAYGMNAPVLALIGQIPQGRYRPRPRPSARDPRPGRHHLRGWSTSPRASARRPTPRPLVAEGYPRDGHRPARPGRARMRDGRLGRARHGDADRAAAAAPTRRSTRTRCARPRSCSAPRRASDDRRAAAARRTRRQKSRSSPPCCRRRCSAIAAAAACSTAAIRSASTLPLGTRTVGRGRCRCSAIGTRMLNPADGSGASTRTSRSSASTPIRRSRSAIASRPSR